MNKKQCSMLLLLAAAINSATAQTVSYPNSVTGVNKARQDVLNAIKANDLQRAETIIRKVPFNKQTKQFLTDALQKAKIGAGTTTIANLQKQLADANSSYQALLVSYQGAETQANGATKSVNDAQQRVDGAKDEHDRLKAENEQLKRSITIQESGVREANALLAEKEKQLEKSKADVDDLNQKLTDAKNAQNAREAARIQDELDKAKQQAELALQEQKAASTDVTELQKDLAQNKKALEQAKTAIDKAHAKVESLTAELKQKEEALDKANAVLAQKDAALAEANAQLNARYAPETQAVLASITPSELRNIFGKLLDNSAAIATNLPMLLTENDASFHQAAQFASSRKPVQTHLLYLAEDNKNKDDQYRPEAPKYSDASKRAQWIIMQAAKNDQKWAQDALLNAKEEYSDRQNGEDIHGITRQPKWAQDALLALASTKDFAFDYVITALEHPDNRQTKNLSPNGLKAFVIDQTNKGHAKFQKYLVEKAVYASWNYDAKVGANYGTWALCALKNAAQDKHAWALEAIAEMFNKNLPLFKEGYTFISKTIGDAVLNDKKGILGGKSNKETYLDQITKWASNWEKYKCDISSILKNKAYINLTISEKIPAVAEKKPVAQPGTPAFAEGSEGKSFAEMTDEEWQEFLKNNKEDWDKLGKAAQDAMELARNKAHQAWESEYGKAAREKASKAGEALSGGASKAGNYVQESRVGQAVGTGASLVGAKLSDAANWAKAELNKIGESDKAKAIASGAKSVKDWTVDTAGNILDKARSAAETVNRYIPENTSEESYNENPSHWESKVGGYMDEGAASSSAPASESAKSEEASSSQPSEEPAKEEAPEPESPF